MTDRLGLSTSIIVFDPTPELVAMVLHALKLPERIQRAQLAIDEHNIHVFVGVLREQGRVRRDSEWYPLLNLFSEMVWRRVALHQSLNRDFLDFVDQGDEHAC